MTSQQTVKMTLQKHKGYSFLEYLEQFDREGLRQFRSEKLDKDLFSKSVKQNLQFKQNALQSQHE